MSRKTTASVQLTNPQTGSVTVTLKAGPKMTGLLKFSQQRQNLGVIRSHRATLPEVAGSARKGNVLNSGLPAHRVGDNVVKVVNAALGVKELKHAAFRNLGTSRPQTAVSANPLVSLAHSITNGRRDISGVCHAVSIAFRAATRCARWDAALSTMVKDLITPEQYELLMASWWAGVGK